MARERLLFLKTRFLTEQKQFIDTQWLTELTFVTYIVNYIFFVQVQIVQYLFIKSLSGYLPFCVTQISFLFLKETCLFRYKRSQMRVVYALSRCSMACSAATCCSSSRTRCWLFCSCRFTIRSSSPCRLKASRSWKW